MPDGQVVPQNTLPTVPARPKGSPQRRNVDILVSLVKRLGVAIMSGSRETQQHMVSKSNAAVRRITPGEGAAATQIPPPPSLIGQDPIEQLRSSLRYQAMLSAYFNGENPDGFGVDGYQYRWQEYLPEPSRALLGIQRLAEDRLKVQ